MLHRRFNAVHKRSIALPYRILQRRFYADEHSRPSKWEITDKLTQWQAVAQKTSKERFNIWTTAAEENLALLGKKLNQLTGYELVEELKKQVVEQGI
jgi:hypothetical protein